MRVARIWMEPYPARTGSICCLARDPKFPANLYILTAGHVAAPLEFLDIGVVERARIQICCELPGRQARVIGRLLDWDPLKYEGPNAHDVGQVEIYQDAHQELLDAVPLPAGYTNALAVGWDICSIGAESQAARKGKIVQSQVASLRYCPPGAMTAASFKPEHHFATECVSVQRDSGAPAFDAGGKLMGMLVAGETEGSQHSYFVRAKVALERFGLKPVLHSEHPGGVSAASLWSQPVAPLAAAAQAPSEEVDVLARTLWGEARGEGRPGIEGVASVVVNRARKRPKAWWGSTIVEVCRKPLQFSCWNPDDPNREKLRAVTEADGAFRTCVDVARAAAGGSLDDATSGATHYHTDAIMPPWARNKTPCARIGHHLFYNNIG
jgi:hypothetical protein